MSAGAAPARTHRRRGFTLVEMLTVTAMTGVLVALAWPSYAQHARRSARGDAVAALLRLQMAQERFHGQAGFYAPDLQTLRLAPLSPEGRYRLEMARPGAERFEARATAAGAQAADTECPELTLTVDAGFVTTGPHGRCWNR